MKLRRQWFWDRLHLTVSALNSILEPVATITRGVRLIPRSESNTSLGKIEISRTTLSFTFAN